MEKTVQGLIGTLTTAAGAALTGLLGQSFGPPVSTFITVIGAVAAVCLVLTGFRYYAILGASESRWDTQEYRTYAALRRRLRRGSTAARLYTRWVRLALRGVAIFFGDYQVRRRTRAHEFFGLQQRDPLWTAPAFDRCLLLAFIYPVTTVLLFWIVSGHVGPAENALHLAAEMPGLASLSCRIYPRGRIGF